jgi:predicted metallo-beta-lactamase superfamily hydrolase
MCTYIETPDVRILVDPGASLGPRYGLIPHPREYLALREARSLLTKYAEKASVITISHYHFDHATPVYTDYLWNLSSPEVAEQIYGDKLILAKDYRNNVNASQRRRGWMLRESLREHVRGFEAADGRTFSFGGTTLRFSYPVPHGEQDTLLGWVIMLCVESCGERIIHGSDVQGPIVDETADWILDERSRLTYVGGPPTYLMEYRNRMDLIGKALYNLERIALVTPNLIVDHHVLRAGQWPEGFDKIIEATKLMGHQVVTAAEHIGLENNLLEHRRIRLYIEYPPSEEFKRWTKLPDSKKRLTPVPV